MKIEFLRNVAERWSRYRTVECANLALAEGATFGLLKNLYQAIRIDDTTYIPFLTVMTISTLSITILQIRMMRSGLRD